MPCVLGTVLAHAVGGAKSAADPNSSMCSLLMCGSSECLFGMEDGLVCHA